MAGFTRQELLSLQTDWKNALMRAATGKSYTVSYGGSTRTLTRYDLPEIRKMLEWIDSELAALEGRRGPLFVQGKYVRSRNDKWLLPWPR